MAKTHRIAHRIDRTYATYDNAVKAVEKKFGPNHEHFGSADLHYIIAATAEGRFYPVFIGESALRAGVHFYFPIAA